MRPGLIILGAGGHGRVLADALHAAGLAVAGFTDRDPVLRGALVLGLPVLGDDAVLEADVWAKHWLVNGLGGGSHGGAARRRLQGVWESAGRRFSGVRHPSAVVSPFAQVDASAQILARAVVQPGAGVGPGCIVNTGAILEHDSRLGCFSHCAPGSILCGGVETGAFCHIGAGSVVREGVRLGQGVVVGAGAVVIRDHDGPGVLVGVPAQERETR